MTDIDKERELIEAAEAVVARWYTPKWKDEPHTAEFIERLRTAADRASNHAAKVRCMDCKLNYDDYPMDIVLSKDQWLMIHPGDGGVLCANCIATRARKLPGAVNLTARITFGRDYDGDTPLPLAEPALKAAKDALLQITFEGPGRSVTIASKALAAMDAVLRATPNHVNAAVDMVGVAPAAPAVQAVGEPGNMPILPQHLLNIIGDYGLARTDGLNELDRIDLWEKLIRAIKTYAWACQPDAPAIQPPPSAEPAPTDPRPVVGIVDERYLRPTSGGEG